MSKDEYALYLNSIHWKQFRRWIMRERGGSCEDCGISNVWAVHSYKSPLQVHHVSYVNVGHEKPEDVRVLCKFCHDGEHSISALPDMSAIFWKLCVALRECPDKAWDWFRMFDQVDISKGAQTTLQFPCTVEASHA